MGLFPPDTSSVKKRSKDRSTVTQLQADRQHADFRASAAKENLTFAEVYSAGLDTPLGFVYPSDVILPQRMIREFLLPCIILGLLYCFVLGIMDIAYTIHLDPFWPVTVWLNLKSAAFGIAGILFVMLFMVAAYLNNNPEAYNFWVACKSWHIINELLSISFIMLVVAGICWGQAWCINRSRNNTNTDLVRWMSGDNGALAVADAQFTSTQQMSVLDVYMVFNVFEFIGYGFAMYLAIQLSNWIKRNDPRGFPMPGN